MTLERLLEYSKAVNVGYDEFDPANALQIIKETEIFTVMDRLEDALMEKFNKIKDKFEGQPVDYYAYNNIRALAGSAGIVVVDGDDEIIHDSIIWRS